MTAALCEMSARQRPPFFAAYLSLLRSTKSHAVVNWTSILDSAIEPHAKNAKGAKETAFAATTTSPAG